MTEIIQNPNGTFAVYDGNELISDGWKKREYAETSVGGRREGAGRKPSTDPRIPLPFRLKTSAVEKAQRLGRDRIEKMIERAKIS